MSSDENSRRNVAVRALSPESEAGESGDDVASINSQRSALDDVASISSQRSVLDDVASMSNQGFEDDDVAPISTQGFEDDEVGSMNSQGSELDDAASMSNQGFDDYDVAPISTQGFEDDDVGSMNSQGSELDDAASMSNQGFDDDDVAPISTQGFEDDDVGSMNSQGSALDDLAPISNEGFEEDEVASTSSQRSGMDEGDLDDTASVNSLRLATGRFDFLADFEHLEEFTLGQYRTAYDKNLSGNHSYLFSENAEDVVSHFSLDRMQVMHFLPMDAIIFPGQKIPLYITDAEHRRIFQSMHEHKQYIALCTDLNDDLMPYYKSCVTVANLISYEVTGPETKIQLQGICRGRIIKTTDYTNVCAVMLDIEDSLSSPIYDNIPARSMMMNRKIGHKNMKALGNLDPELCNFYMTSGADRVSDFLRRWIFGTSVQTALDQGLVRFSYWAAANLPISMEKKAEIFNLNVAEERLLKMSEMIAELNAGVCKECGTILFKVEDLIIMQPEGVSAHYVNPGGYVYDVITVSRVRNFARTAGCFSRKFSWYPGYGWDVINCLTCSKHIGWYFASFEHYPHHFFGVTRDVIDARTVDPALLEDYDM